MRTIEEEFERYLAEAEKAVEKGRLKKSDIYSRFSEFKVKYEKTKERIELYNERAKLNTEPANKRGTVRNMLFEQTHGGLKFNTATRINKLLKDKYDVAIADYEDRITETKNKHPNLDDKEIKKLLKAQGYEKPKVADYKMNMGEDYDTFYGNGKEFKNNFEEAYDAKKRFFESQGINLKGKTANYFRELVFDYFGS